MVDTFSRSRPSRLERQARLNCCRQKKRTRNQFFSVAALHSMSHLFVWPSGYDSQLEIRRMIDRLSRQLLQRKMSLLLRSSFYIDENRKFVFNGQIPSIPYCIIACTVQYAAYLRWSNLLTQFVPSHFCMWSRINLYYWNLLQNEFWALHQEVQSHGLQFHLTNGLEQAVIGLK